MGAILMTNMHGNEVAINDFTFAAIVSRGELHLFNRQVYRKKGIGDPMKILLALGRNGLGDDIHAMPAIAAKIAQGFDVTVIGREFNRLCYESLGCHFIDEKTTWSGDDGTDKTYREDALNEYGAVYSMVMWCIEHDWDSKGEVSVTRFEQFAKFLDVELPKEFNWRKYLLAA